MLIACLVVVGVFLIFIISTFFMTRKTYTFEYNGKKIKFLNSGNSCKIFVDNNLTQTYHMPQLIRGEEFKITVDETEITLKCKCNSFGNKLSLKAFIQDKEIYNNGVVVK